jgi:hypothetical protein
MHVKGLGWDWCKHAWSKNGQKYTVLELAKNHQMIIKKEKSLTVPSKPSLVAPTRVNLVILGTQSSQVSTLDEKYLSNESDIRQKAEHTRWEHEKRGKGSMHSQLQPFSRPNLIDRRIDVLYLYDVDLEDSTKGLRWCQGMVLSVIDDNNVQVDWDPAPDIAGSEEGGIFPTGTRTAVLELGDIGCRYR